MEVRILRYKIMQEVNFNPTSGEVEVESTKVIPILDTGNGSNFIYTAGKVTQSSFDYGLINYPAGSPLQTELYPGDKLKVLYKGIVVPVVVSSVKGRISGLTKIIQSKEFCEEFKAGDSIELIYDSTSRLLKLEKKI